MQHRRHFLSCLVLCLIGGGAAAQETPPHLSIVFDTSGSLSPGRPAVIATVQTLAWSLVLADEAKMPGDIGMSLTAFSRKVRVLSGPGGPRFGPEAWPEVAGRMGVGDGSVEDGYLGLATALERRKDDEPGHLLLITDEDRDEGSRHRQSEILKALHERDLVLDAFVAVRLACADGRRALGLTHQQVGYLLEEDGQFALCTGARPVGGRGTTVSDYVALALASGGSVWDVTAVSEDRRGHSERLQATMDAIAQGYTSAVLNRARWESDADEYLAKPLIQPTLAMPGELVQMDGRYAGARTAGLPVVSWEWDLGADGSVDYYGPDAGHVYSEPGLYPVRLTVSGDGLRRGSRTVWIEVRAP